MSAMPGSAEPERAEPEAAPRRVPRPGMPPAEQAFFRRQGRFFVPQEISLGGWHSATLAGRAIVGLLGAGIEAAEGREGFRPARLTVDMYRPTPWEPLSVATRVVRDGQRIRVVDAELSWGDTAVARASCVFVRPSENPEGRIWSPQPWNVPHPSTLARHLRPGNMFDTVWDLRPVSGLGTAGRKQVWLRDVRTLVEGEPLTPFGRVALSVDYASPLANMGEAPLAYINCDLTCYLHRLPVGEWIGFETINHHATDGVSLGECMLYDETGAFGTAGAVSLAQSRRPDGRPPRG